MGPPRAEPPAILLMTAAMWPEVRAIYLEGIATGDATFANGAPPWEEWDRGHLGTCRLVAQAEGAIAGWAALSPASGRCVYGGVAEVSVYVAERARGRGIGSTLLARLVEESERNGIWTLQAGIFARTRRAWRRTGRLDFAGWERASGSAA